CSAWTTSTFICRLPPPTVDLNADRYLVKFNESANLYWSSTNANTCSASGAWSGSRPVSGGPVSTGPLKVRTSYYLQCHHPDRGYSSPDSATIDIEYGKDANVEINGCGSSSGDATIVRKGSTCNIDWDVGTS